MIPLPGPFSPAIKHPESSFPRGRHGRRGGGPAPGPAVEVGAGSSALDLGEETAEGDVGFGRRAIAGRLGQWAAKGEADAGTAASWPTATAGEGPPAAPSGDDPHTT